MAVACPSDDSLAAYLDGAMPGAERREIEVHVDGCAACRELLAALARTIESDADTVPWREPERYEIIEQVGSGAMGAVYVARDTELGRDVALKILHPPGLGPGSDTSTLSINQPGSTGSAERDRLREEARALAKLSHTNIVQVYDVGEIDGEVFIAMELVLGKTLRAWLDEDPSRSWKEVLDVFTAAGRGLAAAHGAGIVHRDFKPENVLVAGDGRVTVTDFGLATRAGDHTASVADVEVTYAGGGTSRKDTTVAGTPAYMAPELFAGHTADAASDQYSFCVALHEGLYKVRPEPAGAATPAASRVPRWLRGAVARGLATMRKDRFPSMPSLLDHIDGRRRRTRRVRYGGAALLCTAAVVRGAMWIGAATTGGAAAPTPPAALASPPVDARPRLSTADIQIEINKAKAERKKKQYQAVMARLDAITPMVDPPVSKDDKILLARILSLRCRTWGPLKDRNKAADACLRAIGLYEQVHGPDHGALASDVIKVSIILVYAKRWQEAETNILRALALIPKHRPDQYALEFVLRNELGQVYLETDRAELAVSTFRGAARLYQERKLTLVSLHVALYERMSRALWALGKKQEALAAARLALVVAKPKPPKALVRQIEKWITAHESM